MALRVVVEAREQLLVHGCDPLGGRHEPVPVGILADEFQQAADMGHCFGGPGLRLAMFLHDC